MKPIKVLRNGLEAKVVLSCSKRREGNSKLLILRNKNNIYSKKLHQLFKESALLLSKPPGIGKPTNIENVRVKIIKDYLMFYEVNGQEVVILVIWDNRRDPDKKEFV